MRNSSPTAKRATAVTPETPVSVYLVWHEASETAPRHAQRLFEWFRLRTSGESLPQGAGLPVHYRARIRKNARLQPPIKMRAATRNYIVLLIDEHMVADRRWREITGTSRRSEVA